MLSDCAGPCTSTTTIVNSTIFGNDGGTADSTAAACWRPPGRSRSRTRSSLPTPCGGATASNCGSANDLLARPQHRRRTDCPLTATGDHPSTNPQFLMQTRSLSRCSSPTGRQHRQLRAAGQQPRCRRDPGGQPRLHRHGPARHSPDLRAALATSARTSCSSRPRVSSSHACWRRSNRLRHSGATINWGDGTSSAGTVGVDRTDVTGTHTYTEAGVYHGTISFIDSDCIPSTHRSTSRSSTRR